jgi:hypothetical protein
LRRHNVLGLLALAALATLTVVSEADALTGLKTYKLVTVDVVVTPSPAPVGLLGPAAPSAPNASYPNPFARQTQVASSGAAAWDVAPGDAALPVLIAQVSAQPTPTVPVQFVAKPDPNAQYLHVIPHEPPAGFAAGYGTTVYPCAFEVYTYYTNSYKLQDWGYNTSKTGGASSGTFPVENYPTNSYLSWAVPDFAPTFTAYWNQGPGGETTWSGAVKQAQQHCVDLTLTVPNAQPAGTFTAAIEYALYVTLP